MKLLINPPRIIPVDQLKVGDVICSEGDILTVTSIQYKEDGYLRDSFMVEAENDEIECEIVFEGNDSVEVVG